MVILDQLPLELLLAVLHAGPLMRLTPAHVPLPSTGDTDLDMFLFQLRQLFDNPERRPDTALAAQQLRRLAEGEWEGPLVYTMVEDGDLRTETLCQVHAKALALTDGLLVEPAYHLYPDPACLRCLATTVERRQQADAAGIPIETPFDWSDLKGRYAWRQRARVNNPDHALDGQDVSVVVILPVVDGQCVSYTVQPDAGDEYDRELARHGDLIPLGFPKGNMLPECRPCPCGSGVDWSVCTGR